MSAGRFAPSPTSELHIGNLRTAILAWLFARSEGANFYLRIEDIDQQRVKAARRAGRCTDQSIISDLHHLGLDWDEPIWYQSERHELYRLYASQLRTYECFCSRKEIAEAIRAPHQPQQAYPGTCRTLSEKEKAQKRRIRPPAIRVYADQAYETINDRHYGSYGATVDDFVLFRSDGMPSYNFAASLDDALSGITQVCRGSDLLESAPRQSWLIKQLGFQPPEYIHVGLAYDAQGQRLSKRNGSASRAHLLSLGYHDEDIVRLLLRSCGFDECETVAEAVDYMRKENFFPSTKIWEECRLIIDSL